MQGNLKASEMGFIFRSIIEIANQYKNEFFF